jgi:hypothetical protein
MVCCIVALCLLSRPADAKAGLILNGDFEQGYTGFTTEYVLPPTDIVGGVGQYMLVTNPADHHPAGKSYGDHTSGSGLMMMLNGSADPTTIVWSETISVATNSSYDFSLWLSSWTASSPAVLDIQFNGVSIGTPAAPSSSGVWQQFSTTWESGSASSLTITMFDKTTADVGNDFALDDISLNGPSPTAVPTPPSLVLAVSGGVWLAGWSCLRRKKA